MHKKDVAVEDPDISENANVNPSGFHYWQRLVFLLNSDVDFSLTHHSSGPYTVISWHQVQAEKENLSGGLSVDFLLE